VLLWQLARWRRATAASSASRPRRHRPPPGQRPPPGGPPRSGGPPWSGGPADLFAGQQEATPPELPPGSELDRLRREFAVLGFLGDRHPLLLFADEVARAGSLKASDLPRHAGRRIRFAGWLITGKLVHTRQGQPMEFLTFEDETGLVETTFFPEAYRRFCDRLDWGRPYLLSGRVEEEHGATTLTVDQVELLGER
ncbi:MAG: hypothetical protein FJ125_17770, partial [Deltaproteobacteria bacterium]|nr:hypothetical protein [Deltaproteobacteria bacterium]